MIVVDTSVAVALLLEEADASRFASLLIQSSRSIMSAVKAHETATVIGRRIGASGVVLSWQLFYRFSIDIFPFDEAQARTTAAAYDRYGKGIDPKARLNLADCAA